MIYRRYILLSVSGKRKFPGGGKAPSRSALLKINSNERNIN